MAGAISEGLSWRAIFKGLIVALVISLFLSILVTLLLYLTPLSESYLASFATLIFFLSILLGSTFSAKIAGNRGLIHGVSVGIFYLLLTLLIGVLIASDPFSWFLFLKKLFYTLIGGAIGGILGIGLTN